MEITFDICNIVSNFFNIPLETVKNNSGKSLFNEPFNFRPVELLFLYFYLEEKYNIYFNEEDVLDFSFLTVKNISKIVNEKLLLDN